MNENPSQRAYLMAALSAAETITANVVPVPTNLKVVASPLENGPYRLDLYFHHRPESLADFAAALDLPLSLRPHPGDSERPFAEAAGEAYGVAVHAWSLGDAGEEERYQTAVSTSGVACGELPSEWSASAASVTA